MNADRMHKPIRTLIVEDRELDAELAQREVRQALEVCSFQVVETREAYIDALEEFRPHLIIADYMLPQFDGMSALSIALERTPLTPLIILTGSMDEDTAVDCLKAGATDYVIKEHIKRLGPAVLHALRQRQLRRERMQAEQSLRQSEERYRTLVNTLPDAIVVTDVRGQVTYASPLALHLFGYQAPEEMLGTSLLEKVHTQHRDKAFSHIEVVLSGGLIRHQEYLLQKKDNNFFLSELNASCLKDSTGLVTGVTIIIRDITERKHNEEQLIYQASLLQNVSDAIIATDLDYNITMWNHGAHALYGWTADEVHGRRAADVLQTEYDSDEERQWAYQSMEQLGSWKGEVRQRHKNGSTLHIFASISFFKNSSGKPVGAVAINRNITERKRAEQAQAELQAQLQQSQKMESIGRLAGGVAHDFNNLLTVIRMYSELIHANMKPGDDFYKQVEQIRLASQRAEALTRQLLAFSRKQILAPKILNLNELITGLHAMLERLIGEDITFAMELEPELWSVKADASQIEQVIMNLVVNARTAMPTGGLLTIETSNVRLDDEYARSHIQALVGPCVLLTVSDTGHGMDRETQKHIFEPFFTTRPVNEGTGLGLATAHGIVKQSGGEILVYSELGQGTSFKIYLPAQETVASYMNNHHAIQPTTPPAARLHEQNTETILLVEDEDMVRNLVRETLEISGYKVLDARNSHDALHIANRYEDTIHLLLTDVVMPQMSGRELAEALRDDRPQMRVLFVSGYTDDAVVRHGLLKAEVEFLPKPFSSSQLTSKVRAVLDS